MEICKFGVAIGYVDDVVSYQQCVPRAEELYHGVPLRVKSLEEARVLPDDSALNID